MFPSPIILNNYINPPPEPLDPDVVFSLTAFTPATGIRDRGPFNIPITNTGNIEILSDEFGWYMDFNQNTWQYLTFNNGTSFDFKKCIITIRMSGSVITNGTNHSLTGIFDNSNGLALNAVTLGAVKDLSLYSPSTSYYINTVPNPIPNIIEIVLKYDQTNNLCTVQATNAPTKTYAYIPTNSTNVLTYIGSLSGSYANGATYYRSKGKFYSIEIKKIP